MKKQAKRFIVVFFAVMAVGVILSASVFAAGNLMTNATKISFGNTYYGDITSNNAADYYKFTIKSSGRVTLTVNATGMEYVHFYVYDSDGTELWAETSRWNSNIKMTNVNKSLDLTKGTYYFAVIRYNNNTGSYSFKADFISANESFDETGSGTNNLMSNASAVELNTKYNGQIASNDDRDFYRFVLPASGRLSITATAKMRWISYYIYDSAGKEIFSRHREWNSSTEMSNVNETLDLTKGTYYFVACKYDYTGNYSFRLNFVSAGESFAETGLDNDNEMNRANAISVNTKYNGQLASNDDRDFYKFTLASSEKVTVTMTAKMRWISYFIYDSDGTVVMSKYNEWNSTMGLSNRSDDIVLAKGTYYFVVIKYYSYTGSYSFNLSTHTHKYANSETKATSSKNGKTVTACTVCGKVKKTTVIYKASSIKLSKTSYTYNGKAQKPTVTVKTSKGAKLKEGRDYTVKYQSGRKTPGKYTVTITFKGNYSGKKTLTFTIAPKTPTLKVKAGAKKAALSWNKQVGASGYTVYMATSKNGKYKKLTTLKGNKLSYTKTGLTKGKTYYFKVAAYTTSGKTQITGAYSPVKSVKVK